MSSWNYEEIIIDCPKEQKEALKEWIHYMFEPSGYEIRDYQMESHFGDLTKFTLKEDYFIVYRDCDRWGTAEFGDELYHTIDVFPDNLIRSVYEYGTTVSDDYHKEELVYIPEKKKIYAGMIEYCASEEVEPEISYEEALEKGLVKDEDEYYDQFVEPLELELLNPEPEFYIPEAYEPKLDQKYLLKVLNETKEQYPHLYEYLLTLKK